jgi:hypothetical protein|tara:strand:- start:117 stop:302 length:186 start_codon:yes stop_codon:yes gene_type:complete
MNISIHGVTDIIIEDIQVGSTGTGTAWRKIRVRARGSWHEIDLFPALDDADSLELTLGKKL